mgnify:CR=1 FL=1
MANVQLTKDAIEKLNQEAEYLKGSKRAELQEGIEVAKKLSDAEQKEAHDEYAKNESRIAVLEELIDGTFQREAANQTRTAQPVRVTLEGLINLMAELDFLRTTKRQEIKEAIKIAKGFGDLSENSEYDEAREEQGKIESRIVELEEMLKNVDLIDESGNTDQVNVGTKVRIFNRTRNKEVEYYLVGSTEANASLGKISDQSPIGKAIIGEKVGRVVQVEAPAGVMELEILEISK